MSDKRSVATDALETLGTSPLADGVGRDAIHLAVEPVIAAERLLAGQDVGLLPDGKAATYASPLVGIVDPFLKKAVRESQKFWLVVYPRQITSLRHVWSHPAFEDAVAGITDTDRENADKIAKRLKGITPSQTWMREYAERLGVTYDEMMENTKKHVDYGTYWCDGGRFEGESLPDGFWDHYEKITGEQVEENRDDFFTCSC